MEKTVSEEEKRGAETYYLYSPCHLFQQLIKSFYKCLGKDDDDESSTTTTTTTTTTLHHQQAPGANSSSGTETEMKATEEKYALESTATRALTFTRWRSPPRPQPNSGGRGQIN